MRTRRHSEAGTHGSRSNARKAASALIAKIPLALSDYIARQHLPEPARLPASLRIA